MSDIWVEVSTDTIRGDRDGLVELRSLINDALRKGMVEELVEDEQENGNVLIIERVGP